MKIEKIEICNIDIGKTFLYNNKLCLKISDNDNCFDPDLINEGFDNIIVNLSDNKLIGLKDCVKVILIDAKIIIDVL
ncbi:MAG: hypothetical protein BV456_06125 [Thermoplasmata archaeon M8B2D]|nr:MAG: hypothetical protein BV456_06125 [Thermoplasmata archaeon M8B2D]